jgi:hypothetical protein
MFVAQLIFVRLLISRSRSRLLTIVAVTSQSSVMASGSVCPELSTTAAEIPQISARSRDLSGQHANVRRHRSCGSCNNLQVPLGRAKSYDDSHSVVPRLSGLFPSSFLSCCNFAFDARLTKRPYTAGNVVADYAYTAKFNRNTQ